MHCRLTLCGMHARSRSPCQQLGVPRLQTQDLPCHSMQSTLRSMHAKSCGTFRTHLFDKMDRSTQSKGSSTGEYVMDSNGDMTKHNHSIFSSILKASYSSCRTLVRAMQHSGCRQSHMQKGVHVGHGLNKGQLHHWCRQQTLWLQEPSNDVSSHSQAHCVCSRPYDNQSTKSDGAQQIICVTCGWVKLTCGRTCACHPCCAALTSLACCACRACRACHPACQCAYQSACRRASPPRVEACLCAQQSGDYCWRRRLCFCGSCGGLPQLLSPLAHPHLLWSAWSP